MAKIYAPNKRYNGMSAGVSFCNGIGETDNPRLLTWFQAHGYKVEEPAEELSKASKKSSSKKAGE